MQTSELRRAILATSLGVAVLGTAAFLQLGDRADSQTFIIQGSDLATVKTAVHAVGGEITH